MTAVHALARALVGLVVLLVMSMTGAAIAAAGQAVSTGETSPIAHVYDIPSRGIAASVATSEYGLPTTTTTTSHGLRNSPALGLRPRSPLG